MKNGQIENSSQLVNNNWNIMWLSQIKQLKFARNVCRLWQIFTQGNLMYKIIFLIGMKIEWHQLYTVIIPTESPCHYQLADGV